MIRDVFIDNLRGIIEANRVEREGFRRQLSDLITAKESVLKENVQLRQIRNDAITERNRARAEVQKQRDRANRSQNEAQARASELRSLRLKYDVASAKIAAVLDQITYAHNKMGHSGDYESCTAPTCSAIQSALKGIQVTEKEYDVTITSDKTPSDREIELMGELELAVARAKVHEEAARNADQDREKLVAGLRRLIGEGEDD